ncbi:MAG: hypothetical protein AAF585_28075, partial [Verrucomicrobiota bacterium]
AEAAEFIKKARRGAKADEVVRIRNLVREKRDDLQERAMAIDPNASKEEGKTVSVLFHDADVEVMNELGALLRPDFDFGDGFGARIQEAVASQKVEKISGTKKQKGIAIGQSGWIGELLHEARQLLKELESIDENRLKSWRPLADQLDSFQLLLGRIDTYEISRSDTAREFLRLVSDKGLLAQALNEIMALCMPSRFAYEDILPQFDQSSESFDITTDEVNAALRFNTAELNLLALALFLLCAPLRTNNPIRTIVLDDPLQNMDEMTVCTLARGLRRLMRFWANHETLRDWQLLVLLHSETQAERLESEIVCGSYRMPWLSSMETKTKDARRITEESEFEGEVKVQPLTDLFERIS